MNRIERHVNFFLRRFMVHPVDVPDMEYRYGLWRGVSALYSEAGRQIGEENTRPFRFNDHIPAQTHPCKYAGSRAGKLINLSALKIAMAHYEDGAAIVGDVVAFHLMRKTAHGLEPRIGVWDLYILSQAAIAVIAYQQRAETDPAQNMASSRYRAGRRSIDNALASQYQFIAGIFMICRDMIRSGDLRMRENTPLSADTLYTYADENGIFESPDGKVCAGSEAKIRAFLSVCCNGDMTGRATPDQLTALRRHVSDLSGWYDYALAAIEFGIFLELKRSAADTTATEPGNEQTSASDLHTTLRDYCRTLGAPSAASDRIDVGSLERQNHILTLLGRKTLRRLPRTTP